VNDTRDGQPIDHSLADQGHHRRVGRPHSDGEGVIAAAEHVAAQSRSPDHPFGMRGRRFDRRSPFYVGLMASAGVAITYGLVRLLGSASGVLLLIGAALFFALGLEPAVSGLVNRRLPGWAAVTVVLLMVFGVLSGAVAAAIPPRVQETRQFIEQAPHYLQQAQDHSSLFGRINERFHVQQRISEMLHGQGAPTVGGVVKIGETVGVLLDLRNGERDQPMMRLPPGGLQGLAERVRQHPFFNATPWGSGGLWPSASAIRGPGHVRWPGTPMH